MLTLLHTRPVLLPALLLLLAAPAFTGCVSQQQAVHHQQLAALNDDLDSLRTANRWYRQRLLELSDSLQLYDDVATGRYFRERRTLNDRIDKLIFDLETARDGGRPITTLLADDLFEPASATLTPAGTDLLALLAERLRVDFPDRRIRVEGHSDNVPVGPGLKERFPSNWELSAARAAAVVRYLVEDGEIEPERLAVVGLGDAQPAMSNATVEGRRQNRRIRVLVLPNAPVPDAPTAEEAGQP